MEMKLRTAPTSDMTAKQILNKGNWRDSREGWDHWSSVYNDLLLIEARDNEDVTVLDTPALS